MTVQEGCDIQDKQVQHSFETLSRIRDRHMAEGKNPPNYPAIYIGLVNAENDKCAPWKTGWDVPRGVQLEQHYFTALGKTPQEYSAYLASMD